ncbi:hypothetical protein N7481_008603 [Penicillium waksmanii]|uniref:uncharacterized protein n=1 Tax=Penicillium waksmanii TaxID=69791 RepID=UPI00254692B3|nr:uncharacterized protein N7481_008603 [Penicillium waksmanii]KAJ5974896.1 hypothetical protein N7481_008603 [Penicillium waksmanii]
MEQQLKSSNDRSSDTNNAILPLPLELLYDILDCLSLEDTISFAFSRWDFLLASLDFLKHKVGPTLRHLNFLAVLFNESRWPRSWLYKIVQSSLQCEQPILRDICILTGIFEDIDCPERIMRYIISTCAESNWPISHSCVLRGFKGIGGLYLQRSPHAIFDTDKLGMSILHVSILSRAPQVFNVVHRILKATPEPEQVDFVNKLDCMAHSALTYAISTCSVDMLDALILVGANINRRDRFGFTPLIEAGYFGYREIIDCLIRHGAVFTARDGVGHSILEHIMNGKAEMKQQLLEHISPFASQEQLDSALRYDFENTNGHTATLVKLGANPENVGLSAGDIQSNSSSSKALESDIPG